MKLTDKKLREIIREELSSTDKVDEIAPVIAAVARQAAAAAIADKVTETIKEGLVPTPEEAVKMITASADMYNEDDNEEHVGENYMKETKEILENAISKIAKKVATDMATDAVKKKMS